MLLKSTVAIAAVITFSSSVLAADIYEPSGGSYKDAPVIAAPYMWEGAYVGINVGYGWSDKNHAAIDVLGPPNSIYPLSALYDTEFEGAVGGAQIGYNIQRGDLVFGVEADIQAADFSADDAIADPFNVNPPSVLKTSLNIDWFGTLRGRLGWATDKTLFYATGGLAYGKVETSAAYTTPLTTVFLDSDDTELGYAVGGGIEQALGDGWTLKAEYLYVDLGEVESTATFRDETYETTADAEFHVFRVGLNYLVNQQYQPLK